LEIASTESKSALRVHQLFMGETPKTTLVHLRGLFQPATAGFVPVVAVLTAGLPNRPQRSQLNHSAIGNHGIFQHHHNSTADIKS
jgi:hypothetical protein